jgi:hypothetical protein
LAEAVEKLVPQADFQQQTAALALRELRREVGTGPRAPVAGEVLRLQYELLLLDVAVGI